MTRLIDQPAVLQVLFHPRSEYGYPAPTADVRPVAIPVATDVRIGGVCIPPAPMPRSSCISTATARLPPTMMRLPRCTTRLARRC